MYCKNCGQELSETDAFCTQCGQSVAEKNESLPAVIEEKKVVKKARFAWAVLGFFIPVAGLILFIIWKSEHPDVARKAGIGALAGVVTEVIVAIFSCIISLVATFVPLAVYYSGALESMLYI